MKIFITGVAGFLGSNLAFNLVGRGYDVSGNDNLICGYKDNISSDINFFDTDCCNFIEMKKSLKEYDVLIHCAATAHEGLSSFSPSFITRNIFQASVTTFSAAISNNVKKIIYCSSMARYGNQKHPFVEEMTTEPCDPYGIEKVAAENSYDYVLDFSQGVILYQLDSHDLTQLVIDKINKISIEKAD